MLAYELSSYQALAVASLALIVGRACVKHFPFLNRYCIPEAVVGGVIVALINGVAYAMGLGYLTFDTTLQTFFMMVFYCTVGVTASFRLLKTGGLHVMLFLTLACLLCVLQNAIGCGLATLLGFDSRLGLAMGSMALVGGHGTSGSFGPELERLGVAGAQTLAMASATFGLVAGSMMGGPLARVHILRRGLRSDDNGESPLAKAENLPARLIDKTRFLNAGLWLGLSVGLGAWIYLFLKAQGITFPVYIGAMLMGCLFRNITDARGKDMNLEEIDCLGSVSLKMYLAMALMGLKLWELSGLALAASAILVAQVLVMAAFAYFIVFACMGRDYEAACYTTAICGFGMGATANALANIQAVNRVYGASPKALFVVPIVGALFIDFCNSLIIMFFLN